MHRFTAGLAFVALFCLHVSSAVADDEIYAPTGTVESKYFVEGPSRVKRMTSGEPCDQRGHLCDVWYPVDIQSGWPRAAILWANGTSDAPVEPKVYDYLLSHFASWGFVVIATRDPNTGHGNTVLDALDC
ncbi:hypothetical protein [Rhizobium sp. NPDC090279]|uniref:hypothetical protein n=1 Tax=Rhizobium sp. NPDC090279 TaxID=3364499 RepID=UPI003839E2EF